MEIKQKRNHYLRQWRLRNPDKLRAYYQRTSLKRKLQSTGRKNRMYIDAVTNIQSIYRVVHKNQAFYLKLLLNRKGLNYVTEKTNQGYRVKRVSE